AIISLYVPDCSPAGFSNSFRLLRWDRILSYISNLCIPGVLSLSLLPDSLRTVLAVKGSLRHTKQRRALDGSGPFLTTFLRCGKGSRCKDHTGNNLRNQLAPDELNPTSSPEIIAVRYNRTKVLADGTVRKNNA